MARILVAICKDFDRVVRERRQDSDIEVSCLIANGQLQDFGDGNWVTMMTRESEATIARVQRLGATITGYIRLDDGSGFNPISNEPAKSVADRVNSIAWRKIMRTVLG